MCAEGVAGQDESAIEREIAGFGFAALERLQAAAESAGLALCAAPPPSARFQAYLIRERP